MSQLKLLSISAFYRNDAPGGIGLQLLDGYVPDLQLLMLEIAIAYRLYWRAAVMDGTQHLVIRDSLTVLDRLGRKDKQLPVSEENVVSIVGNIWLLEEIGVIRGNEYNGMSYISDGGCYDPPRLR